MEKKFATLVITIISLLLAQTSFAMGGGGGGGHGMSDSSFEQMHDSQSDENHTPVHTEQERGDVSQSHMDTNNDAHRENPPSNSHQRDLSNIGD